MASQMTQEDEDGGMSDWLGKGEGGGGKGKGDQE